MLPKFSAVIIVICKCHMYDLDEGGYGMILGRDSLTSLVPDGYSSDHFLIGGALIHEVC